ncbi:tetratricopeptide repeat protein [Pontibacter burrus]|uniref:TonB C-terminal domain-containing protein n=1 Tax=Pontibacter burrus TaxID=2704466 RepID=A0A6B3LYS2_9BACT|nr:hypothetical protein [Pontibacter burrus]NEM98587.1 hypothetical protein [Pontibacter burrus]
MTKLYLSLLTFLLIFSLTCSAQISSSDISTLHNAATYKGGYDELIKLLAKNIKFPQKAVMDGKLVTVIGVLKTDRNGEILEVGTLHKVDDNFTEAFKNVIRKTNGKWQPTNDTSKYFYAVIPVQFSYHESGYTLIETNKPAYLQETIVVSLAGRPGAFTGMYEKYESDLVAQVNELYNKQAFTEAIRPMMELVNLQPLHPSYYDTLITLLQKTGNTAEAKHYEQVKALLTPIN